MRQVLLTLACALVAAVAAAQPARYAVLVQGASGEPQFAAQHRGWLDQVASTLTGNFKIAPDHVRVLAEQPKAGEERATAEIVKATLARIAQMRRFGEKPEKPASSDALQSVFSH